MVLEQDSAVYEAILNVLSILRHLRQRSWETRANVQHSRLRQKYSTSSGQPSGVGQYMTETLSYRWAMKIYVGSSAL